MAKEVAIGKRAKISEAQQYMLLTVLGASVILGIAISLTVRFIQQISFNTSVIAAEEQSIASYTDFIKTVGVCKKPQGSTYSESELKNCTPDSIDVSEVSGTLRANVLENLAANEALNSVPKEDTSGSCRDQSTGKQYTYSDLMKIYNSATTSENRTEASQLIRSCSALRVIPDTLPAFKNEEALLASLNKLFIMSNWEPESISPGGADSNEIETVAGVEPLSVNLSINANASTTMNVLNHIERSVREFDIKSAVIEWSGDDGLDLQARAYAYYVDESSVAESTKTISPDTVNSNTTGGNNK